MEVVVADDQLSLAIGKRGQNVRLAAQLTGWRLDIKSESKLEEQLSSSKNLLASIEGIGDMRAEILVHEGIKTVADLSNTSPRSLIRLLNMEQADAEALVERAKKLLQNPDFLRGAPRAGSLDDETRELLANAVADPTFGKAAVDNKADEDRQRRIEIFLQLSGVGEATVHALADAGYATIGDIIADSAEEVAQKTGLSLGIARTVQIAADRYMQEGLNDDT
jgi:N utilization substance protein A